MRDWALPAAITATLGPPSRRARTKSVRNSMSVPQAGRRQPALFHPRQPAGALFIRLKAYAKDRLKDAGVTQINMMSAIPACRKMNLQLPAATLRQDNAYGRQISAIISGKLTMTSDPF